MLILGGSTCAPITFLFVDQSSLFLPNARILVDFGGVCAIKLWSISSACANLREQHLLGAEIWSSDKLIYFVVSEPKFTWLFSSNAGRIAVDILVFRFSISRSGFGDIRGWSLKLSKIAPNFARFGQKNSYSFCAGRTPTNFGTCIVTLNTVPITRQSFTSEISRGEKKKERKKRNFSSKT